MPAEVLARAALASSISPLSSSQQRVWRLARIHRALFERISVRLIGPLRMRDVTAAVHSVMRRQTMLRAVFPMVDGTPVQCIRPDSRDPLLVDLQALPVSRRDDAAHRLARADRQPAFDPMRGPLARLALVRIDPGEHVLLATVHHLVFDGDSREILMRELGECLFAASGRAGTHEHRDRPLLTVSYGDIARRERRTSVVTDRTRRLQRLADRLQGLRHQEPATLPLDRPRSAYRTRRGGQLPITITQETVRSLRAFARAEGLSMSMLLVAALAIVLRRATGRDDVTLGMPVATRTTADEERTIGPFVNILVVPIVTAGAMRVRDVIAHARTVMLDVLTDRDLPFDDLLRALYPGRELASYGPAEGPPLFRVCVDFRDSVDSVRGSTAATAATTATATAAAPGAISGTPSRFDLTLSPFAARDVWVGCDLFVSLTSTGNTLAGTALYSAELFDRSTVQACLDDLRDTLGSLHRSSLS